MKKRQIKKQIRKTASYVILKEEQLYQKKWDSWRQRIAGKMFSEFIDMAQAEGLLPSSAFSATSAVKDVLSRSSFED